MGCDSGHSLATPFHTGTNFVVSRNVKLQHLPASTTYTVEQALDKVKSEALSDVLILGWDSVTGELVVRSSRMDRADALWLVMKGQEWALNVDNED